MKKLPQRVKTLSEALPYIQRFRDKIIVIKYGGSAMLNEQLKQQFARDIVLLKEVGMHPVVVHGGGPNISKALDAAGIASHFVNGLRVTDDKAIQIVEKTLAEVNQSIVDEINDHAGHAISVLDHLIRAQRLPPIEEDGESVDLGFVGQVTGIAGELKKIVVDKMHIPVISPIGKGQDGSSYNVNADLAASGVAVKLEAEKLIMLTDTAGVLDEKEELIEKAGSVEVMKMIEQGTVHGGMLPKVQCAFEAVQKGVCAVHIVDGRVEHALLLELLTDKGVGTLITKD